MANNTKDNLQAYEEIVKTAAENKSDKNIPNSTMAHAEIGLRYLLGNAREESTIQVVTRSFYGPFWGKLKSMLIRFFENNGILEVILLQDPDDILVDLKEKYKKNIKTFLLGEKLKKNAPIIPHFVVIEPAGYRIELSDKQKQEKIVEGFVNFGDGEGTSQLKEFFDKLKLEAREIPS